MSAPETEMETEMEMEMETAARVSAPEMVMETAARAWAPCACTTHIHWLRRSEVSSSEPHTGLVVVRAQVPGV